MKTLVIGDIHGSPAALVDILSRADMITTTFKRKDKENHRIIQVGDLLNFAPDGKDYRGYQSQDHIVAKLVYENELIDEILVGNHEAWFTHGIPEGQWLGMAEFWQLHPETMLWVNRLMMHNGAFKFATSAYGFLITHAGLPKKFLPEFQFGDANSIANVLNETDGFDPYVRESILWNRYADAIPGVPQIYGHTPNPANPRFLNKQNAWCIDSGGYMQHRGTGILWDENASQPQWRVVT